MALASIPQVADSALTMHTTPGSLLQRLRLSGDPGGKGSAWERFVQLYTPLLYTWARCMKVPRQEAVDLVQDVLTLLVQKLPDFTYDPQKSFRAWLRTVTLNKYRETLRRQHPEVQADEAFLEDVHKSGSSDTFEEQEYRRHLVGRALKLMQAEFQPKTWKACWEHVVSGRSAAEVARELGMSEGAVYVAKYRVLRRLREELQGLLD
jgi:RNA polymerase sigma-70 factor, ECF subfamily